MKTLARAVAAALPAALSTLLLATTVSAAWQQAPAGATSSDTQTSARSVDTGPQVVPEQELILHYYTPKHSDAYELAQILSQLAGRMFFAQAQDGTASAPISNVRTFGNVVVLYDRVKRVEQLVTILAELEAANVLPAAQADELVVVEYEPQYIPTNALLEVLSPLRRQIPQPSILKSRGQQPGQGGWVQNVTGISQPATIVLRDTRENVEEMLALMKRLDVAPPQAQLTCWLLRGAEEETDSRLPGELVQNLSRLVPTEHFEQLSMSMISTSVQPGQPQRLVSDFSNFGERARFELDLISSGFDRSAGVLPLTRCRFEATSGQEFETSVTLKAGEYTVLGAAGADPLFVVLKFVPLED
ncbi:MAG: hypothetical protein ACYTG2_11540 [Planctomycetota bacterium]|jgi:type II secretory pathway component GspD/PulD (secretin)